MEERALGARYVVGERIGQGAMGEVYEGRARSNDEPVAIKYLRQEFAEDTEIVGRFLQERTILLAIHGPHVVQVRDLVYDDGRLAIVMELVHGKDLRHLLYVRRGSLSEYEAAVVCSQVLDGLADVHSAGVFHRDVKPENVLISFAADGAITAKITDFGIARIAQGQRLTKLSGIIGTPTYMAPEVALDDESVSKPTSAVDVYAVGVMCYELVTGAPPFQSSNVIGMLRQHVDALPARPAAMSDQLWSIVARMLAKNPAQRPTAAAAALALRQLVSSDITEEATVVSTVPRPDVSVEDPLVASSLAGTAGAVSPADVGTSGRTSVQDSDTHIWDAVSAAAGIADDDDSAATSIPSRDDSLAPVGWRTPFRDRPTKFERRVGRGGSSDANDDDERNHTFIAAASDERRSPDAIAERPIADLSAATLVGIANYRREEVERGPRRWGIGLLAGGSIAIAGIVVALAEPSSRRDKAILVTVVLCGGLALALVGAVAAKLLGVLRDRRESRAVLRARRVGVALCEATLRVIDESPLAIEKSESLA